MQTPAVVRIVQSIAELDPAQWDRCANPRDPGDRSRLGPRRRHRRRQHRGRALQPFHLPCLPARAGELEVRRRANRLGADARRGGEQGRPARGGGALLRQDPIRWANTSSITPGPTPTIAPGSTIIPSCRSACRSRRSQAVGCWWRPTPTRSPTETLIAGLKAWRGKIEASSVHVTFATRAEAAAMGEAGFLQRTGQQFHFVNEGYRDFEHFLESLASRKRKVIRRERRDALGNGITIECLTGAALTPEHWKAFYDLLHRHRLAQMGPALPHPRLLRDGRRQHGRAHPAGHGEGARASGSPAPSTSSATTRCTAATGAASRSTRSCISRCATTRPSSGRSTTS